MHRCDTMRNIQGSDGVSRRLNCSYASAESDIYSTRASIWHQTHRLRKWRSGGIVAWRTAKSCWLPLWLAMPVHTSFRLKYMLKDQSAKNHGNQGAVMVELILVAAKALASSDWPLTGVQGFSPWSLQHIPPRRSLRLLSA